MSWRVEGAEERCRGAYAAHCKPALRWLSLAPAKPAAAGPPTRLADGRHPLATHFNLELALACIWAARQAHVAQGGSSGGGSGGGGKPSQQDRDSRGRREPRSSHGAGSAHGAADVADSPMVRYQSVCAGWGERKRAGPRARSQDMYAYLLARTGNSRVPTRPTPQHSVAPPASGLRRRTSGGMHISFVHCPSVHSTTCLPEHLHCSCLHQRPGMLAALRRRVLPAMAAARQRPGSGCNSIVLGCVTDVKQKSGDVRIASYLRHRGAL